MKKKTKYIQNKGTKKETKKTRTNERKNDRQQQTNN